MTAESRRKALGKGLEELFPGIGDEVGPAVSGGVEIGLIDPNPYQPRREWSSADIQSLTASILAQGILQPLVLRRKGRRFQLIAGERRLRAAREAGLQTVPAVIREADDEQMLALALMENIQRTDLGPMEKAEAFSRLSGEFGLTQEEMGRQVGMSRSAVANFQRLLDLPASVQDLIRRGALQMGHGRALLGLTDRGMMERLASVAGRREYSVRTLEERVRRLSAGSRAGGKPRKPADGSPEVRKLVEDLQRLLKTRVRLKVAGGSAGSIEISYHSLLELERLLELFRKGAGKS
jgi:ParB family transcriptional regulator, chromosome partitioning protein